jgi:nitrous oxidase accessory protein NosD
VLNSTAGGSVVRDLTFANFADDAIRLNSTLNATVNGVAVRTSGFGITLNGTSTGTKVQGNVLDRNATGVRLLSATGALVGGSAAGQGNTISNARVGVFASGFCTRSQVVRNRITGTLTPYDVRSSRNLTVVR